jgi:hypothetical protein
MVPSGELGRKVHILSVNRSIEGTYHRFLNSSFFDCLPAKGVACRTPFVSLRESHDLREGDIVARPVPVFARLKGLTQDVPTPGNGKPIGKVA